MNPQWQQKSEDGTPLNLFDEKQDKKDRHMEQQEQKKLNDEYRQQQKDAQTAVHLRQVRRTLAPRKSGPMMVCGKYNAEGFTGRVQGASRSSGPPAEQAWGWLTDQCPFDCRLLLYANYQSSNE
jgi:hypothetical protein